MPAAAGEARAETAGQRTGPRWGRGGCAVALRAARLASAGARRPIRCLPRARPELVPAPGRAVRHRPVGPRDPGAVVHLSPPRADGPAGFRGRQRVGSVPHPPPPPRLGATASYGHPAGLRANRSCPPLSCSSRSASSLRHQWQLPGLFCASLEKSLPLALLVPPATFRGHVCGCWSPPPPSLLLLLPISADFASPFRCSIFFSQYPNLVTSRGEVHQKIPHYIGSASRSHKKKNDAIEEAHNKYIWKRGYY
ncbi:unnamed protein product [Urochloa humidicola]